MFIHILGSAAGGGFPQWNCNCPNCSGLRNGTLNAKARTQSSIAVSSNGVDWVLFNTSPDILAQLANFSAIQPARTVRDTGIRAIIYMDSQIDHTTGLLMLREGCPHDIYCTDMVYEDLTSGFPVFNMLEHWNGGIRRHPISFPSDATDYAEATSTFSIPAIEGLSFTAIPLRSKAPPYSPHRHDPHLGDNIGIKIEDLSSGRNLFYAPGLGEVESHVNAHMQAADCLLVDGTFWQQDEMASVGLGNKLATDMGHLPLSGENGMISILRELDKPRKILIHINNTNPILDEDSEQRKILARENIEVSYDGMELQL